MPKKKIENFELTEHEGILLAAALRQQPVTAYQLVRLFEGSPVSSFNASKGQVYPAVRRLKARGFLTAKRVKDDARNTEALEVTEAGKTAIRHWILNIGEAQVVVDDPLRSRMLSIDLLGREERLGWVALAKSLVKDKQEILEDYNQAVTVPFQAIAYQSASETLQVKMEWLDELLYAIAAQK